MPKLKDMMCYWIESQDCGLISSGVETELLLIASIFASFRRELTDMNQGRLRRKLFRDGNIEGLLSIGNWVAEMNRRLISWEPPDCLLG